MEKSRACIEKLIANLWIFVNEKQASGEWLGASSCQN